MPATTSRLPAAEIKDSANIRRFVEKAATALGGRPGEISELVMAVNEAVENIMMHGYRGQPGLIVIEIQRRHRALVVRLLDQAPPFDPTRVPAPDTSLPLEERKPGGLGVHMMRQFTDQLHHRVTPEGQNELILVKEAC